MDKQEKMFSLVDQWKKSGLTRKSFAQQHGITDSSLEYWCRKRDNKVSHPTSVPIGFVEISPKQGSMPKVSKNTNAAMVELEFPNGIKLKIY